MDQELIKEINQKEKNSLKKKKYNPYWVVFSIRQQNIKLY